MCGGPLRASAHDEPEQRQGEQPGPVGSHSDHLRVSNPRVLRQRVVMEPAAAGDWRGPIGRADSSPRLLVRAAQGASRARATRPTAGSRAAATCRLWSCCRCRSPPPSAPRCCPERGSNPVQQMGAGILR